MDQTSNNKSPQARVKRLVCENCGRSMRVRMPEKPNKYKVTCPSCSHKMSFEVSPAQEKDRKVLRSDILDDRVISRQAQQQEKAVKPRVETPAAPKIPKVPSVVPPKIPSQKAEAGTGRVNDNLPVLGTPIRYKDSEKLFVIKNRAQVDTPYKVACPSCGYDIMLMAREADTVIREKCSHCGITVAFKAATQEQLEKTKKSPKNDHVIPGPPELPKLPEVPEIPSSNEGRKTINLGLGTNDVKKKMTLSFEKPKGMLVWKSGSLMRRMKFFVLNEGSNTIGRFDELMPSTVMIEGDLEMSRRSVEINVVRVKGQSDYFYDLAILKSTNPVFVNGRPVGYGKKVRLNYGDTICMGKTTISFVKRKDTK